MVGKSVCGAGRQRDWGLRSSANGHRTVETRPVDSRLVWPVCALLLIALTAGCTQRSWYEGVKQSHEHQCNLLPESEREDCLAQHDDHYEDYQRKRGEISE